MRFMVKLLCDGRRPSHKSLTINRQPPPFSQNSSGPLILHSGKDRVVGILFRVRARGNPPLGFCAAGILFRVRARGNPPLGFCAAGILFRVRARGSVRVLSKQHPSLCPITPPRSVQSVSLVLSCVLPPRAAQRERPAYPPER